MTLVNKKAISYSTIKIVSKGSNKSIQIILLNGIRYKVIYIIDIYIIIFFIKFSFESEREFEECFDLLESLWYSCNQTGNYKIFQPKINPLEDSEVLTNEEWDLLLDGSKTKLFVKDQIIIQEGDNFQRIYQISEGICRIEKGGNILGTLETGQTFGEISFLISGGATASVIANSEKVIVIILEGYFMNILFGRKPEIAGRFYKVKF